MTHLDKGHFAAKHPPERTIDRNLAEVVKQNLEDGGLACGMAHTLAKALGVAPAAVGEAADLLEVRIVRCQLGLFGHSPQRKIVTPAPQVSAALTAALQGAAREARLSCLLCWEIADSRGLPRLQASCACETLGLRIERCQLGAF